MITGDPRSNRIERTWPLSGPTPCWNNFTFTNPFCKQGFEQDTHPVSDEAAWQRVRLACQDEKLVACHFRSDDPSCHSKGAVMTAAGLLVGHGYILRRVVQLADQQGPEMQSALSRLVLLQNPWQACSTWSGAWAPEDARWQGQFAATLRKLQVDSFPETSSSTGSTTGNFFAASSFWMAWEDLVQHAESITLLELPSVGQSALLLLSAPPSFEAAKCSWSLVGPDLWQDLSQQDPDFHQADLISWPDGMSDTQFPLDSRVFPKTAITKWVSASRIHRLMRYGEDGRGDNGSTWWATVAVDSGGTAPAQVCSVMSPWVMRSGVGDRWLCAAVASLSLLRWPLEACLEKCPAQPLEARDGSYTLLLHDPFKNFRRTEVLINDRVPCFPLYGNARGRPAGWRPCFASSLYRQMWPMLLEKGIAKILGGYHCLDGPLGHTVPLAWAMLTGVTSFGSLFPWPWTAPKSGPEAWGEGEFDLEKCWDKYEFQSRSFNELQSNVVQQRLRILLEAQQPVACCFQPMDATEDGDEEDIDDLVPGHAYALLQIRAATGKQQLRLLGPWQGGAGAGSAAEQLRLRRARELAMEDSLQAQGQVAGDETHFWLPWEEFETRVSCIFFSTSFWARELGGSGEKHQQVFEETEGEKHQQVFEETEGYNEVHGSGRTSDEEESLLQQGPPPVVLQEPASVVHQAAGRTPASVVRHEPPAVVQQAAGQTPYQPPAAGFQCRVDTQQTSYAPSDVCEHVANEIISDAASPEEQQATELGRQEGVLQEVRDLLRRPGRLRAEQAESMLSKLVEGLDLQGPMGSNLRARGERLRVQINAVQAQIRMRLSGDGSSKKEPCQTGAAAANTESFEDRTAELPPAAAARPEDQEMQLSSLEDRLREVRAVLRRPGRLRARERAEEAQSMLIDLVDGLDHLQLSSDDLREQAEQLRGQIEALQGQVRARLFENRGDKDESFQTRRVSSDTESSEDLAAERCSVGASPADKAAQLGSLESKLREARDLLSIPGRLRAEQAKSLLVEASQGLDCLQPWGNMREQVERLRGQIDALQTHVSERLLEASSHERPCQTSCATSDAGGSKDLRAETFAAAPSHADQAMQLGSLEAKLQQVREILSRPGGLHAGLQAEQAQSILVEALASLDRLQLWGSLRDEAERLRGQIDALQTHVRERMLEASSHEHPCQTSCATSDVGGSEDPRAETFAAAPSHEDQATQLGIVEAKLQEVREIMSRPCGLHGRLQAEQAQSILVAASVDLDCLQSWGSLRDEAERLRGQIDALQTHVSERMLEASSHEHPCQTRCATSDVVGSKDLRAETFAAAPSHEDQAMQLGIVEAKLQEVREIMSRPGGLHARLQAEQAQSILVAASKGLDCLQLWGSLRDEAERLRGQIDALQTHVHARLLEDSTIDDLGHISRATSNTESSGDFAAELSAADVASPENQAVQLISLEAKLQEVRALLRRPGRSRARERAEQARVMLVEVSEGLGSLQLCDDLREQGEQLRDQMDALQGQADAKLARADSNDDFGQTSCVTPDVASSREPATRGRGHEANQANLAAQFRSPEAKLQEVQHVLHRPGNGSSDAGCMKSDTASCKGLSAELERWEARVQDIRDLLQRPGEVPPEVIQAKLVEVSEGLDNMQVQGDLKNRRLQILNRINALEAEVATRLLGGGSCRDRTRTQSTPPATPNSENCGAEVAFHEARLQQTCDQPRSAPAQREVASTHVNDHRVVHSTPVPAAHCASPTPSSEPNRSTKASCEEVDEQECTEDSDEHGSNTETEASTDEEEEEEASTFAGHEASSSSSGSSEDEARQIASKRSSFRMRVRKQSGLFRITEERERAVVVIRRVRVTGLKGHQLRPYVRTEYKAVFRTTPVAAGNDPSWDGVDWILNPTVGSMQFLLRVMHKPFYSFSNTGWTHVELGQAVCDFQKEGASPGRHHTLKLNLLAGEKGQPTGARIEIDLVWFDSTSSENTLSRMEDAGAYPEYELRHAELKPQLPGPGLLLLRLSLPADAGAEVELGSTKRSVSGKSRKLVRWLRKKSADEHELVMPFKASDEQLSIELPGKGEAHLFFRDLVPGRWSMASTKTLGIDGKSGNVKTSVYWLPEVGHRPGPLEGTFLAGRGAEVAHLEVANMEIFGLKSLARGSTLPVVRMHLGGRTQTMKLEEDVRQRSMSVRWFSRDLTTFRLEPGDCQLDLEVRTKGSSFRRAVRLGSLNVPFRSRELGGRRDFAVDEPLVDGAGARISFRLSWQSPSQRLSDISVTHRDAQEVGLSPTSYRRSRLSTGAPARKVISSEAVHEQSGTESASSSDSEESYRTFKETEPEEES
eukprot:TRINITY_DN2675_c0_g1_i1.p1 TRINITY_DN2675_c0_g1~~TRINITY_DN2675_c0_g1_i1.p1  ORF type:complete len:2584 (+),score=495.39 TRINITY_DN2675_c0_g1_i1:785-7753(+)